VIELATPWSDDKGQPVAAGLYTLRDAAQPLMKEHRGVSEFRDVLLLAPLPESRSAGRPESRAPKRGSAARLRTVTFPALDGHLAPGAEVCICSKANP
jgi:hypothetical protein